MKVTLKRFVLMLSVIMLLFSGMLGIALSEELSAENVSPEVKGVTDDQSTFIDLSTLLTEAQLIKNGVPVSGAWVIQPNQEYTIRLVFTETNGDGSRQFANDATPMVYKLPDGLTLGSEGFTRYFDLNLGIDGIIENNAYTYDPNTNSIAVVWNTEDEQFSKLTSVGTASFTLDLTTIFSNVNGRIIFSDTVTVDTTDSHLATISKEGSYSAETGKINYTVKVENTGNSSNVTVTDMLSGTILSYHEGDTITWTSTASGHSGSYTITAADIANDTFTLNLGDMTDGEVITITYSADVDYTKMDHYVADNIYSHTGKYVSTEAETKNTATVKADDQNDLSASWYTEEITSEGLEKSGVWETVDDNTRRIHWTVVVNKEATISLAGKVITDTLSSANASYTSYDTSEPITLTVKDRDGTVETRTIQWNDETDSFTYVSTDAQDTWSYTVPSNDGCKSYTFDYYTLVDVTGLNSNPSISNKVEVDKHGISGNVTVPAGTAKFELAKEVDKAAAGNNKGWTEDYSYWKITITVPAVGSNKGWLYESLPMVAYNGDIFSMSLTQVIMRMAT